MLLTFNSGSSTVKLGLFEVGKTGARRLAKGVVDFRDEPLAFSLNAGSRTAKVELGGTEPGNVAGVLTQVLATLGKDYDLDRLVAAGHRVVHGGDVFGGPVVVDDEALSSMEALAVLAPLHQPQSLEFVRTMRRLRPGLTQVASFDTAFHARGDAIARRFAIPRALHDAGIKRYGFHGLSYQSIANTLRRDFPASADGRVIVAHLGSGASLCGMEAGVSRDTSMGFSTLDGIPMATRCGAIDPGVLLHLLGPSGKSLDEVEDMLYHRSGMLGVSGFEADSRELLASDRPEAHEAIDLFTLRIAGEIGRLAMTLGGLDALVFTAGIGENQPRIRAAVCTRLAWLGAKLDSAANAANATLVSLPESRIEILVVETDEEQVMADETMRLTGKPLPR